LITSISQRVHAWLQLHVIYRVQAFHWRILLNIFKCNVLI